MRAVVYCPQTLNMKPELSVLRRRHIQHVSICSAEVLTGFHKDYYIVCVYIQIERGNMIK